MIRCAFWCRKYINSLHWDYMCSCIPTFLSFHLVSICVRILAAGQCSGNITVFETRHWGLESWPGSARSKGPQVIDPHTT